jgi:3-isopropylmalate dehydrogenase
MDAFGNLRPCSFPSETLLDISPIKEEIVKGVDFTVIRELCGGIYFGKRKEWTEGADDHAWDTELYSRSEIVRIARMAGNMAMTSDPPAKVMSLDKANVMATSRLWRKVVTETMEKEFPKVQVSHQYIDSAAMLLIKNPRSLNGIVITSNLFGDIITDEASMIPGSLGLLPSASLMDIPEAGKRVNGIYEPIHGSAPDIAGQGIVNPVAAILSVSMLLKYSLCRPDIAEKVDKAVKQVIDNKIRTKDIGGSSTTTEVGDAVAKALGELLSSK